MGRAPCKCTGKNSVLVKTTIIVMGSQNLSQGVISGSALYFNTNIP